MPKNYRKIAKIVKIAKMAKTLKMPKTPRVSGDIIRNMEDLKGGQRAGNEDLEGIEGTQGGGQKIEKS